MNSNLWQWAPRKYFQSYVTPREFKKGARDIPFGQGAKSLFVDDANGDDHSDGETWKTAFKTIQNGLDNAESWTNIFAKAGTYAENITVANHRIQLIGEDEETTFISPPTGHAIITNANHLDLSGFTIKVTGALCKCIDLEGNRNTIHDCIFDGAVSSDLGLTGLGDYNVAHHCRCTADMSAFVVDGSFWEFYNCHAEGATNGWGFYPGGDNLLLHDNFVKNCKWGIQLHANSDYCSIYHNNLIGSITAQAKDDGSNNKWRENFYDDHTNIDNGFGIATEPYSFTGGIDPRPVICRNGWNSISIERALLRKKTGKQATQAAIDANGTSWVDLKSISPTTSDLELHRIQMTVAGAWAGTAKYRIIVDSDKVYPFGNDKNISTGVLETFIFPINVQINETVKIQFRSDNAGDGAGETVALDQLDYTGVV